MERSRSKPVRYSPLETNQRRTQKQILCWKILLATVVLTLALYYLSLPSSSQGSPSPSNYVLEEINVPVQPHKSPDEIRNGIEMSDDEVAKIEKVRPPEQPAKETNMKCVLPEVPLQSPALDLDQIVDIPSCDDDEARTFTQLLEDGVLVLLASDMYTKEECCVYEILRPYHFPDDTYSFKGAGCQVFDGQNKLSVTGIEHLVVSCTNLVTNQTVFNFHAQVLTSKPSVNSGLDYWKDKRNDLPVNVMILVLDSTSRADALRSLPKTMNFLTESLNFVEFPKFHGLGEPTMRNAIPLLTGIPTKAFFQHHSWEEPWDNVSSFIWKNFQRAEYVTAYIEDIPSVGTFNYGGQKGFEKPPTSLYMRPFFSAYETMTQRPLHHFGTPLKTCLGSKTPWQVIYEYELEILRKLNGKVPTFTMPWLCWPFHDFFRTLAVLEEDTLKFFKDIAKSKEILENTLIIVMADHGFYGSPYSVTHEGYLERRLPLFMIRLPERLTSRFPQFKDSIKSNSEEVMSHYDVYKTLLHLSQLAREESSESTSLAEGLGQSLFIPLSRNRNCTEAGVPENFCACGLPSKRPGTDSMPANVPIQEMEPYSNQRRRLKSPRQKKVRHEKSDFLKLRNYKM